MRAPPRRRGDWGRGPRLRSLGDVSTRTLIILSLVCGLAVVVAFAIQAVQIL